VVHRYCDGPIRTCITCLRRPTIPTTLAGRGERRGIGLVFFVFVVIAVAASCSCVKFKTSCNRKSAFNFQHRNGKRAKLENYRSSFVVLQSELEGFIETLSGKLSTWR